MSLPDLELNTNEGSVDETPTAGNNPCPSTNDTPSDGSLPDWCYVCREHGHDTKGCRAWLTDMKENFDPSIFDLEKKKLLTDHLVASRYKWPPS